MMLCFRENHCQTEETRLRVLVVEDDGTATDWLRKLLEAQGFAVQTADCYKAALQAATEWMPDMLVSDIRLPDKSGLDVIHSLRSAYPNLKAIAVSGCSKPDDDPTILAAGVSAYLPKPLDAERLGNLIRHLLANER